MCAAHWAETSDPSHYPIPKDWVTIHIPHKLEYVGPFFCLPMVSTKPCGQEAIFSQLTTNWYNILVHWVGIKPMTQDSQSQTWTTQPVVCTVTCTFLVSYLVCHKYNFIYWVIGMVPDSCPPSNDAANSMGAKANSSPKSKHTMASSVSIKAQSKRRHKGRKEGSFERVSKC